MDRNKTTLENQKNQLIMKKRITELEAANKTSDAHAKAVTDQLVAALRENARLVGFHLFPKLRSYRKISSRLMVLVI